MIKESSPVPPAPPEIIELPEVVDVTVPEVVPDTVPVVTGVVLPSVPPAVEPPVPPAPPEIIELPEVVDVTVPEVVPDTVPVVTGVVLPSVPPAVEPPVPPAPPEIIELPEVVDVTVPEVVPDTVPVVTGVVLPSVPPAVEPPVPPAPPEIIELPEVVDVTVPEVVPDTVPVVTGVVLPSVPPAVEPPVPPAPPEIIELPEVVDVTVPEVVPDTVPVVTGEVTPGRPASAEARVPVEPPGLANKADHPTPEGVPGLLLASLMNNGVDGTGPFFVLNLGEEWNPGLGEKPDFSEDLPPGLMVAATHHDFTERPPFELPEQANDRAPGPRMNLEAPAFTVSGLLVAENSGHANLPEGVMPASRFVEMLSNGFFDLKGEGHPLAGLTISDMPPAVQAPDFDERFPNLFLADEEGAIGLRPDGFSGVPTGIRLIEGYAANLDFRAVAPGDFLSMTGEWLTSLLEGYLEGMNLGGGQEEPVSDFGKMAMLTKMTAFLGVTNMFRANNWSHLINAGFLIDPHLEASKMHGYVDNREISGRGKEVVRKKTVETDAEIMVFDEESGSFIPKPGNDAEELQEEWLQEYYENFDRQDLYRIWNVGAE
ncbi:hypothetical protein [Nitrospina gracilis]|uniref:hypothetical protein n=1 Tax=Nitrospina gracilis TaxID=35801 RepID=UPI001F203BCF|nr:hypothetical protein [Nitrospina gracilis]MCF8720899.1 hypothetical protein [Nitrospina gracilis Nb-211]